MKVLNHIREKIQKRDYYLSIHAEEELWEDRLDRYDAEYAILNGSIDKKLTHDHRGTRYRIIGPSRDGRTIFIICRFKELGELLIVTAYAKD